MDNLQQPWEFQLVIELFSQDFLNFFEAKSPLNPDALLQLLIDLLLQETSEVSAASTNPKSAISSYSKNIEAIEAVQEFISVKDEKYKQLVKIDELFAQQAFQIEFIKEGELDSLHQLKLEKSWKKSTILHFFLFVTLAKSKIWPRLFKEIRSGKKSEREWHIHLFYEDFRKEFKDKVQLGFSAGVFSKKHQKDINKETIKLKSNNQFIQAVKDQDIKIIKEMLQSGTSVESIDGAEQCTAAHIACDIGNLGMFRLLDSFGSNWEALDGEQMTPIFYAIRGENLDALRFLIDEKKVNIEHQEIMQRTPFYWACCLGKIIRYLIQAGVDVNAKTKMRRTALNKACFLGRADVVSLLISQPSVDIEWGDLKGRNPLHNAIFGPRGGREGKKVVPKKLDIPLDVGTFGKDCPEAAQMLLDRGVNVDAEDVDQSTPLHVACSSEALDSIPLLISYGADVNKQNKFGDTCLHFASKFGHISTVKMLVERFKVILLEDFKGHTALECALQNGHLDVYEYLIKNIAKEYLQTPDQKYRHFKNLLEERGEKQQKLYIDCFIENILDESDYSQFFNPEIIDLLPQLRDVEVFVTLLKKFRQMIDQEKVCSTLLLGVIKQRRIDLFNSLYENFSKELEASTFPNFIEMIEQVLELNDKEIVTYCFTLNLNIFEYRCPSRFNNSFLHELVYRRKTGVIINLVKYINNKYPPTLLKNQFMVKNQSNLEFIIGFIMLKNSQNMNCLEQAMIIKYFDIYNILEQLCTKNLLLSKQLVEFGIPEFEILDLDEHLTKNPELKEFYSFAQTAETRLHLHKNEIELINNKIEEEKVSKQYDINLIEEISFEQEIKSASQEEKKILFQQKRDSSSSPIFIDTLEQLETLVVPSLKQYQVIGVDLEYWHDTKDPKIAFVATLQLSTLNSNFVIDTLLLKLETSKTLRQFFESSHYIKVLHGGETDLKLLKKDLNINTINVFDTAKADLLKQDDQANSVSLNQLSIEYLSIPMDKSYQISDWRIRPLPQPMLNYAIGDSFTTLMLFFAMKHSISQEDLTNMASSCNKMCFRQLEKSAFNFLKVYVLK